jgi:transcription initiation factor TFIIIB Brf1 subunit/transcription initiation factor TFIIB
MVAMARRVHSWQRSNSVAFGAKRTLTEARSQIRKICEYMPYTY